MFLAFFQYSDEITLKIIDKQEGDYFVGDISKKEVLEAFADEVITHLRHMYKHRFSLKNDVVAKRYQLDKNDLIKQINFGIDLNTSDVAMRGPTDKYRAPNFKVKSKFTYFMNG